MNEPIQEKTTTPPGLLPKHVQSWLILGLAVLMVVIMWLTGGKKQASLPKANASTIQTPLPLEVNETKITDLQNRIQELQREQLAAQSALVQQNRLLGAAQDPQQPNRATHPALRHRAAPKIRFKQSETAAIRFAVLLQYRAKLPKERPGSAVSPLRTVVTKPGCRSFQSFPRWT